MSDDEPFAVAPGSSYNLRAVPVAEREFFLLGEGRDDKADGQHNGKYDVEFHDLLWELRSVFYHSGKNPRTQRFAGTLGRVRICSDRKLVHCAIEQLTPITKRNS